MVFAKPISFERAMQTIEIRSLLPTTLSSEELSEISSDILDRAFFSARVHDAEILQEISDVLDDYTKGRIGQAEARLVLKRFLAEVSYIPAGPGIADLTTTARLDLIIETNSSMAAGYGDWLYNQQPAILDQWPAQELFRAAQSKMHRNWRGDDGDMPNEPIEGRWLEAGGTIYDGKMIALRNDDIWVNISRFGTPYPPFDFNSHMRTRLVPRRTAIDIGLIDRDAQIAPQSRRFNETLQSSADVRSNSLRAALRAAGYHFTREGTLTP
jgi:hypothetical protein